MSEQAEARIRVFEAVNAAVRGALTEVDEADLHAFTAMSAGPESRWVQELVWEELGKRDRAAGTF